MAHTRASCLTLVLIAACGGASGADTSATAATGSSGDPSTASTAIDDPTAGPSGDPTGDPTADPSGDPTADPSGDPTADPSGDPTSDSDSATGDDPPPVICDPPVQPAPVDPADHVIGDGSPASCDQASLATAIAAGGTIVFDCGPDPVTITLDASLKIIEDTVIDGGGKVTLSGGGQVRILDMNTGNFEATGPKLTVQHLRFIDGKASGTPIPLGTDVDGGGGAIFHLGGDVVAIGCTFENNEAALLGPDVAGGAIYGIGVGSTTIVDSTFKNNRAANGGAVGALHTALTIVNSTFKDNHATGNGANYIDEMGNQAGQGGNGGAIVMDGEDRTLTICGTTVAGSTAGAFGAALFRTGYHGEPTDIDRSTFENNSIPDGMEGAGGLYIQGTAVRLTNSTIADNTTRGSAGVWILGHGGQAATADLTNVTITGNRTWPQPDFTMRGIGAGLTIGDNTTGTILNCTIAGNEAQFGAGILRVTPLTVRNTILSSIVENQYAPINCTGSMFATPPGAGDHNLQWPNGLKDDMDCTPGITRVDPQLGPLADNGGPTRTMAPLPGSPALAAGTDCPPTDQRGTPRAEPCTLGAFEAP